MRRLFDFLEKILQYLAVGATLLMLLLLGAQVIMRYVFNLPLSWSEEIAMLLFTWVVLISTAIGLRRNIHARLDLLADALPPILRAIWGRLISLLILALGVFITYSGWNYLSEMGGSISPATGYPIEALYAIGPFFGILIVLFSIERVFYGDGMNNE